MTSQRKLMSKRRGKSTKLVLCGAPLGDDGKYTCPVKTPHSSGLCYTHRKGRFGDADS